MTGPVGLDGRSAGPDRAPCTLQYFKWGRQLHWRHDLVHLGRDEHGIWLGAEAETLMQKGVEPPVAVPSAFVQLIRPDDPWTAIFNAPPAKYEVYVDLTTPAEWLGDGRIELIDLDLDVIRRPDGAVALIDEDEWAEHQQRYGYPADLVATTETAAASLVERVAGRTEPFGTAAVPWLDLVT